MTDDAIQAEVQPEKPQESVALKLAKMVMLRRMGDFWRAQIALGDEADDYETAPPGLLEAIHRPITDADIQEEARLLDEEWRHGRINCSDSEGA